MDTTYNRLNRQVIPIAYDIALDASPKRQTFTGELLLTAKVLQKTQTITLHARDLRLSHVVATLQTLSQTAKVVYLPEQEQVCLHFKTPIKPGKLKLSLVFKGKLSNSMHGLYLAQDGMNKALVSQCEAADARAIFPCFDEPEFKAKLCWRITTDPGLCVITNGVLSHQRKVRGQNKILHTFKPTKAISTYLAALTIGDFESTKAKRVHGTSCRIWSGPGQISNTAFAMQVTEYVLPWYEDYFAEGYHYQKLDQVAVPGFDAGAMENVGAIFYRQNLLLMQANNTSWQAQKRIAEVIAHEIAHQWFGNLVTMRWWDDLWLNEAFATWIAFKACDNWQPSWRMWGDFAEAKESALIADALANTHPIYTSIDSPAQATELFDVITYEKGCAVLRMVESFLGEKVFRLGIRRYIAAFKEGNATGADLWNNLERAAKQPVAELMQNWIETPGFPLLSVTLSHQEGRTVLHMHQRRFHADVKNMQQQSPSNTATWLIPVIVQYDLGNGTKSFRVLLNDAETTVPLPEDGHALWVYANADASGFYRMHLDDDCLQSVVTHGRSQLSPTARASLLHDQWALVGCGLANVEQFMDVLAAYKQEDDYAVVHAMTTCLWALHDTLVTSDLTAAFAKFVRWLLGYQLAELSFQTNPEEPPSRAVRRAHVVAALGELGQDTSVLQQAENLCAQDMADPTYLEANLADVVVRLAAIRGQTAQLEHYLETYRKRVKARLAPQAQTRYLYALSAFQEPKVIDQVLQLCINGSIPQDQLRTVLVPLLRQPKSQQATWQFLQTNWQQIGPKIGSMGIARLVEAVGNLPLQQKATVQEFFTQNPVPEATRALQKAFEAMHLRDDLVNREYKRLADWLESATYA